MDRLAAEAILLDMARTLYGEDSVQVKVLLHPTEAATLLLDYKKTCTCGHAEFRSREARYHYSDCPVLKAIEVFWPA